LGEYEKGGRKKNAVSLAKERGESGRVHIRKGEQIKTSPFHPISKKA